MANRCGSPVLCCILYRLHGILRSSEGVNNIITVAWTGIVLDLQCFVSISLKDSPMAYYDT